MRKGKKKLLRRFAAVALTVLLILAASFLPTLRLETAGMSKLEGTWVRVYYETEEAAARDVFSLAEESAQSLLERLGLETKPLITLYIYDDQLTFQTKKYGLIGRLSGLSWYIGDNRGTNVLLTSPARPGSVHGYEVVLQAALHEMVHAYNSVLNPRMPLWLDEGAASYLTNGNPPADLFRHAAVPSYRDTRTSNPVRFGSIGGYDFACAYIGYLDRTYGWDTVLSLLKTADYEKFLQKSTETVYRDWVFDSRAAK